MSRDIRNHPCKPYTGGAYIVGDVLGGGNVLRCELMYESPTKRIRLSVWKDSRRNLVMHLQEYDVDPSDPKFESFVMFSSWSLTVAREPCARATDKAVERFYNAHIAKARALVEDRKRVLEGSDASVQQPEA